MTRSRQTPRYQRLLELLIAARGDAGLSQVGLARRLGKPQSYVSKFESGERRLDVVELLDVTGSIGCSVLAIVEELLLLES